MTEIRLKSSRVVALILSSCHESLDFCFRQVFPQPTQLACVLLAGAPCHSFDHRNELLNQIDCNRFVLSKFSHLIRLYVSPKGLSRLSQVFLWLAVVIDFAADLVAAERSRDREPRLLVSVKFYSQTPDRYSKHFGSPGPIISAQMQRVQNVSSLDFEKGGNAAQWPISLANQRRLLSNGARTI